MSWLRVDDSFMQHPKFEGWKAPQKWAFLELMGYCAKYRTEGRVPADLALLPRSVTPGLLTLAEQSKWLDRDETGALWVHDWSAYNPKDPTASLRVKAYRERNANRNESRNIARDETVTSRARQHARSRPVPYTTPEEPSVLGSSDVDLEAGSSTHTAVQEHDPGDPVHRLLKVLRDANDATEAVLRSFQLPEAAYDRARDDTIAHGGKTGYAVAILRRIRDEGKLASPQPVADDPDPPRQNANAYKPLNDPAEKIEPDPAALELAKAWLNGSHEEAPF